MRENEQGSSLFVYYSVGKRAVQEAIDVEVADSADEEKAICSRNCRGTVMNYGSC